LNLPEIKETLISQGVIPVGGKPDMLDQLIRSEIKVWADVVQKGKILVN
jgi:tripartite-type tricarboxylate transporter receptor subunit TctC